MSKPRGGNPVVDVVILSNAHTPQLAEYTQRTVDTCLSGANGLPVGIAVLEQADVIHKRCATLKMPPAFHYNAFANFGAGRGSADWILVANNDLIFHDGWLHNLLAVNHPLVSPKCPGDPRQEDITENTLGTVTGKHFSGWCFLISRKMWEQMGGFDEAVSFWCSDDVVIEQAKALGVTPMLVADSLVEHTVSETLKTRQDADELTWKQLDAFIAKYGTHRLESHPGYLRWKSESFRT